MKTHNSAREQILGRLRQQRSTASDIGYKPQQPEPTTQSSLINKTTLNDLIDQLRGNHAQVICCDASDFPNHLVEYLDQYDEKTLTCSAHPELLGLLDSHPTCSSYTRVNAHFSQENLFERCEISICWAEAGVMNPGCLMLASSPLQPRGLSLIPATNILVVKQEALYADLAALFRGEHWPRGSLPSNIMLVSGPSKTADIQQTLAYGAHGPKHLVVFILT